METPVPLSHRGSSKSPVGRSLDRGSLNPPGYLPHLENKTIIEDDLQVFESSMSVDTAVRYLGLDSRGRIIDKLLDDTQMESNFRQDGINVKKSEFFFVNRYLIKKGVPWPEDANKFRLSPSAFSLLRSYFELSLTFLSIISNIHHPLARACPLPSRISNDTLDFWFVLPVRVQVHCSNRKNHGSYSAGKSQMNPLNYLHLANTKSEAVDIRGSQIGVYFRFDQAKLRSSTLVINFQDGRWRRVVEVPIMRMKETLEDARGGDSGKDPFYLQTVLLTSILRWWSNALNSFNDQLIAYEEKMLAEEQPSNTNFSTLNSETSRALHCMTAHLHRYGSELALLSEIVQDIKRYNTDSHEKFVKYGIRPIKALDHISRSLDQISSHLSSISQFRNELQLKTDNVLSLLVDNAQIMNERLLIENSKAMQAILEAAHTSTERSHELTLQSHELTNEINKILQSTNEETKASLQLAKQTQRLSEEMMKDSVYMKTIALLTVLFLPGTSFAAVLSMPFFGEDGWMRNVSRFWLWIALTVPTTALCFTFYVVWGKKEARRKKALQNEDEKV